MGIVATHSNDTVKVYRDGVELSSGTAFIPGEILDVVYAIAPREGVVLDIWGRFGKFIPSPTFSYKVGCNHYRAAEISTNAAAYTYTTFKLQVSQNATKMVRVVVARSASMEYFEIGRAFMLRPPPRPQNMSVASTSNL